jgi:hypothetical protein
VLLLVVITGVLVYQGNQPPATAGTPTRAGSGPGTGVIDTSPARTSPARKATNVPMTKIKSGQNPPQFIIFSFDGAGDHEKWQEFMKAAAPTDSRFNGFLTGTYLLTDENAKEYAGPGHAPGKSSVGFGGTGDELATRIKDLNQAYAAGHEIGTHYNGHFCSGAEPSVGVWTTADWNNELDQFFGFLKSYKKNNPGVKLPTLKVPVSSIKGGRTPCLEGQWDQLVPAWKQHKMTYDSSMNAPASGVFWPQRVNGIWEFYMPYVYSPGFDGMVVNMDYNMWVKFNGGADQPETAPELREKVYQTYEYIYQEAYNGNRAPVIIANHFNDWNGDSFNPAVLKFMKNYCGKPNTYCTTYSDVIAWMKLQDPEYLQHLLDQPPVAAAAPR